MLRYKNTVIHKIISALTALLLLPLLLTGNGIRDRHEHSSDQHHRPYSFSVSDDHALPVIVYAEEFTSAEPVRLSRSGIRKLPLQPEWFICFFNGAIRLITAALLLYVISTLMSVNIVPSRRYIIKYIHDQDGHKL